MCVPLRPVLDPEREYEHNGQRRKGGFWMEHGVAVETGINDAKELRFTGVPSLVSTSP